MKLFLFDLDGTLCQTYYADDNSFVKAASKVIGHPFDKTSWRGCEHLTDSAIFDHFYKSKNSNIPEKTVVDEMKFHFMSILEEKYEIDQSFFKEIPGAADFIQQINSYQTHKIGVATGGWSHIADFKLNKIGLNPDQIEVIGSDDHYSKVDFTAALINRIKLKNGKNDFKHIYYFGDSLYDKACCETLGIEFIGIDFKQDNRLLESGVKRVYNNFHQVKLQDFL
jgi:phosphoglycolate phosphatase-like HAD superfamily hydrolase